MSSLSLSDYLQTRSNSEVKEKHNTGETYRAFQEEFAKWESTVIHLKPGIADAIRENFGSRPPALLTLVEYSQPYDKKDVGDAPTIDSVLPRFRDAGFASVLQRPLELSLGNSDCDHSPLLYPHVEPNDIIVGVLSSSSTDGWNIDVLRICNHKLGHLWNVRLKAFCKYSSVESSCHASWKPALESGSYVKVGVVRVPTNATEPIEVTMKRNELSLGWNDRHQVLGLSDEQCVFSDCVTEEHQDLSSTLKADGRFSNPSSGLAMAHHFHVSDYVSLTQPLVLDRKKYADMLRGPQEAIWAEDVSASGFRSFSQKSDYNKAMELFNQALDLNPQCLSAQLGKAMVYGVESEFERSLRYIHMILDQTLDAQQLEDVRNRKVDVLTLKREVIQAVKILQSLHARYRNSKAKSFPLDPKYQCLLQMATDSSKGGDTTATGSNLPETPSRMSLPSLPSPPPHVGAKPTTQHYESEKRGDDRYRRREDDRDRRENRSSRDVVFQDSGSSRHHRRDDYDRYEDSRRRTYDRDVRRDGEDRYMDRPYRDTVESSRYKSDDYGYKDERRDGYRGDRQEYSRERRPQELRENQGHLQGDNRRSAYYHDQDRRYYDDSRRWHRGDDDRSEKKSYRDEFSESRHLGDSDRHRGIDDHHRSDSRRRDSHRDYNEYDHHRDERRSRPDPYAGYGSRGSTSSNLNSLPQTSSSSRSGPPMNQPPHHTLSGLKLRTPTFHQSDHSMSSSSHYGRSSSSYQMLVGGPESLLDRPQISSSSSQPESFSRGSSASKKRSRDDASPTDGRSHHSAHLEGVNKAPKMFPSSSPHSHSSS